MSGQKFFRFPWATSGDKIAIPDDVQSSGYVSYTQGFGPDYERNPATDALAKRVPRDETNQLYSDITDNLRQYQLAGVPEWVTAAQNGAVSVPYALGARVRLGTVVYGSLVANNTATPGTDETLWATDEPMSRALVQGDRMNYAVAGGTVNALTAGLTPVPASLYAGLTANLLISGANTGAMTLNLNGLGVKNVVGDDNSVLPANSVFPGQVATFVYNGTVWLLVGYAASQAPPRNIAIFDAPGVTNFTVPQGIFRVYGEVYAGGGGGGGSTSGNAGGGGGGGGYGEGWINVTPGQVIPITVGVAGTAGNSSGSNGGSGGTSSIGGSITSLGGGGGGGTNGVAGGGGTSSGGQFGYLGGSGGTGFFVVAGTAQGGFGAPAYRGTVIPGSISQGTAAYGPGGGGAGGGNGGGGGAGRAGLVRITY